MFAPGFSQQNATVLLILVKNVMVFKCFCVFVSQAVRSWNESSQSVGSGKVRFTARYKCTISSMPNLYTNYSATKLVRLHELMEVSLLAPDLLELPVPPAEKEKRGMM